MFNKIPSTPLKMQQQNQIKIYYELAPTDPWCNMLQTLVGRKKYEEAMSDEHSLVSDKLLWTLYKRWSFPLRISSVNVNKSVWPNVVTFTEEIFNGKIHFFVQCCLLATYSIF